MAKTITRTLKLEGLTCIACEAKIEKKLKKIDGVLTAKASYVNLRLSITLDESKVSMSDVIRTIEQLGYQVVQEDANTDPKANTNFWVVTGIVVAGLFLLIKNTVGFNFIPEINQNMGYGILFMIGILTSLHCVAMCGGINLSVCVSYKFDKEDKSRYAKLVPSFLYNAGRVLSYTVIGGVIGALGSVISITNGGRAFVSIAAGVFMVIMGLNMLNIFPWLRRINPHMPKVFAQKINSQKTNKGPFIVGILNGLMPCGPLQAMQIYALGTGSFFAGALSMFLFSLGTVPLMFAFGALGSLLSATFTKKMVKVSAVLVVVLGITMLNRGVVFTGFSVGSLMSFMHTSSDTSESSDTTAATVSDEVQKIETTLSAREYPPITVKSGVPVEWTIVANQGSLNGCNNKIIIPEYDIEQKLVVGENIIRFTPTETGSFAYSCWMGMIRSSITVKVDTGGTNSTNSIENTFETSATDNTTVVDETGIPAGCCGIE